MSEENNQKTTVSFQQSSSSSGKFLETSAIYYSLETLMAFLFPPQLQHPLVAARLFAFAYYGPLNDNNKLRCGKFGKKVLQDYELDEICMNFEREDILLIYLHNPRQMGLLTMKEQEMIINQADKHLKSAKGRASLPAISQEDVLNVLNGVRRNEYGELNFNDSQTAITNFRDARIKQLKLVYPQLATGASSSSDASGNAKTKSNSFKLGKTVSATVAPATMFQRMKGLRNSDVVEVTTEYLNNHSFKIVSFESNSATDICANVRLLREIEPKCEDPYVKRDGNRVKPSWNKVANMTGCSIGSFVQATPSGSTWKRKYTTY